MRHCSLRPSGTLSTKKRAIFHSTCNTASLQTTTNMVLEDHNHIEKEATTITEVALVPLGHNTGISRYTTRVIIPKATSTIRVTTTIEIVPPGDTTRAALINSSSNILVNTKKEVAVVVAQIQPLLEDLLGNKIKIKHSITTRKTMMNKAITIQDFEI